MWTNEEMEELQYYKRELNHYPVVRDPKKVTQLIKRWRNHGDRRAYDQLVCGNGGLVISIAYKYRNNGVPLKDLVQEGFLGLMRALKDFDPKQGSQLSTYATWWIKSYLIRTIEDTSAKRPYRLTNKAYQMANLVAKTTRSFFNKYGWWPGDQELHDWIHAVDGAAKETKLARDMTIKQIKFCRYLLNQRYLSLDAPLTTDGENGHSLGEVIADTKMDVAQIVEKRQDLHKIEAELNKLEPRTRAILRLRFLEEITLGGIGKRFGLSRERVRQIEEEAFEKIRRKLKIKNKNSK